MPLLSYSFVLEYSQYPFVIFYDHYLSYWSTIAEPESTIGYCKGGANPKKGWNLFYFKWFIRPRWN